MYNFEKTDISRADEFAKKNGIFQQTAGWARFRKLFRPDAFVGTDENGETVLSCMLFRLPVYCTPWSIGYITRGFVCDYENRELVAEFTEYLKAYMKKKHIIYLIFDPFCDYKIDFKEPENDICKFFESLGYIKNEKLVLQPRTNYRLHIDPKNDPKEEEKRLYSNFTVRLKNDIKFSHDRGAELHVSTPETLDEYVEIFYKLLVETTDKKGFGRRDLDYYKKFASSLDPQAKIYLYKYNSKKDKEYTEKVLADVHAQIKRFEGEIADPETTDKKRERLAPKLKEAYKQLEATERRLKITEKYSDDPYLSASFFIKMGNKAYNFYGANAGALRELKLTANYWDMIKDSLDGQVTTFNMGGTLELNTDELKKDPMYELYQYKCMYHGEFVEMPGEYFLIRSPKLFELFHNKLRYFRRMVFHF